VNVLLAAPIKTKLTLPPFIPALYTLSLSLSCPCYHNTTVLDSLYLPPAVTFKKWLCTLSRLCLRVPCDPHINPLKLELNPICCLLALLGGHHFLHVSRIRVKFLTFRLLMSYIYGAPILDVCRSHTTTQHSR